MEKYILALEIIDMESFIFICKLGGSTNDYIIKNVGFVEYNKKHVFFSTEGQSFSSTINNYDLYPLPVEEIDKIIELKNNIKNNRSNPQLKPIDNNQTEIINSNQYLLKRSDFSTPFFIETIKQKSYKFINSLEKNSQKPLGLSDYLNLVALVATVYENYHLYNGKFRGKSGNYYTFQNRVGWNQYTGNKKYMQKTLNKAKWAKTAGRAIGFTNYAITTTEFFYDDMSFATYQIEMSSNTISTFGPPIISIPWTIGYEGLGRNGIARIPWYQNTFKPYVRNLIGIND